MAISVLPASEVVSSRVAVNGLRLHVDDYGGSGRALWFAHATGFLGRTWFPIITRLRKRGFDGRILTFDARGHGLSSKPDKGYAWAEMAADMVQLMESLEIREALGVGLSAGSTLLTIGEANQPHLFERLLLFDPIFLSPVDDAPPPGEDNHMARRTENRRLVWSSREEILASYSARPPYDRWTKESLENYVRFGTFERPDGEVELLCPGRIEAMVYRSSVQAEVLPMLGRIHVPVHVVRAEHSDAFSVERAERSMEAFGDNAHLSVVEGCGHFLPMEMPDLVTDMIVAEWEACETRRV